MEEVVTEGANPRERLRMAGSWSASSREGGSFFLPEKNKKNEEVGGGSQGEVVMESAQDRPQSDRDRGHPCRAGSIVRFGSVDGSGAARDALRRSIQPGGVNMVRFGLACGQSKTNQVSGISLESSADRRPSMRGSKPFWLRMPCRRHRYRQGCQAESGRLRPISNTVWAAVRAPRDQRCVPAAVAGVPPKP